MIIVSYRCHCIWCRELVVKAPQQTMVLEKQAVDTDRGEAYLIAFFKRSQIWIYLHLPECNYIILHHQRFSLS